MEGKIDSELLLALDVPEKERIKAVDRLTLKWYNG